MTTLEVDSSNLKESLAAEHSGVQGEVHALKSSIEQKLKQLSEDL